MTRLFLYVVASSKNPDQIECVVPYQINDRLIFFGPCKKRLRERLRNEYLKQADELEPQEDVFIVGVNGSNSQKVRKIVWVGHIRRLMTYETAFHTLSTPEFQAMRTHSYSPLHLKPLYDLAGEFLGYEHVSREHEGFWHLDILAINNHPQVQASPKQLLLRPDAQRHEVFIRDCSLLCDNLFFANGNGLTITPEIIQLLSEAQPGKKIDAYALFGYRSNGSVEGLTGKYLEMTGQSAERFISLIKSNPPTLSKQTNKPLKPCRCK